MIWLKAFLSKHNLVLEVGQFFLVHVRSLQSVVLWERALSRVYDLYMRATRSGVPSFRKMLVILWFSRSEMYGILYV